MKKNSLIEWIFILGLIGWIHLLIMIWTAAFSPNRIVMIYFRELWIEFILYHIIVFFQIYCFVKVRKDN